MDLQISGSVDSIILTFFRNLLFVKPEFHGIYIRTSGELAGFRTRIA